MKVPEKIYLHPDLDSIFGMTERSCESEIEYFRTDTFIEKVQSFLNKHHDGDYYTIGYIKRHFSEIIKELGI